MSTVTTAPPPRRAGGARPRGDGVRRRRLRGTGSAARRPRRRVALVWVFPIYWMISSAFLPTNRTPACRNRRSSPSTARSPISGGCSTTDPSSTHSVKISLARHRHHHRRRDPVRIPRRAGAEQIPFPWPEIVHRDHSRGADDPGRGAVHLAVPDARLAGAWSTRSRASTIVYVGGDPALHDLDAARVRQRGADRAGGGRDDRRAAPAPAPSSGSRSRCSRRAWWPSGVYGFLQAWNEYTLALVVMTDPEQRTLPLWLQGLVEANRATDWGLVMAGADAHRGARHRLLPVRPEPAHRRPRRRAR